MTMFEMHPGALEPEMARRDEVLRGSMTPRRGEAQTHHRRVAEVVRFRHVVATLVAAAR
jgi:hypothetical protein